MLHEKIHPSTGRAIGILGALILAGIVIAGRVHGAEVTVEKQVSVPNIRAQQERLNLITYSPLIARGQTLGEVVVFDDPATRRSADYLEVYDITKRLVAIVWFDSFGIQRTVLDRALVEGGVKLEGVLVSVSEGEPV
jgi:hypothetical protein